METLFSFNNLFTLAMLTLLQAVLGFDNLLYISLESKRAPHEKQSMVRRLGDWNCHHFLDCSAFYSY